MDATEWARGGSTASLMSQSWVGCDQGHTGRVEGEGAENWYVGEVRRKSGDHLIVFRSCRNML